jgi:CRISPR-associated protein Cmr1
LGPGRASNDLAEVGPIGVAPVILLSPPLLSGVACEAEILFTLSTPASIGSYEPYRVDELWYVRPTAIKGLWRWWARAIVAGIMYESGLLARCDENELKLLSEYVGKRLGLGEAGGLASRFKLIVYPEEPPRKLNVCIKYDEGTEYFANRLADRLKKSNITVFVENSSSSGAARSSPAGANVDANCDVTVTVNKTKKGKIRHHIDLQRIHLLSLSTGGPDVGHIAEVLSSFVVGGRFKLSVKYYGEDVDVFKAGIGILLLALILGGVGKGSRKGLGSVDIIDARSTDGEFDLASYCSDCAQKGPSCCLKNLLNETMELVRRAVGVGERSVEPQDLPCVPALARSDVGAIAKRPAKVIYYGKGDSLLTINLGHVPIAEIYEIRPSGTQGPDLFRTLHNFFLRAERARKLAEDSELPDPLRGLYENAAMPRSYVLGLPRVQKKENTGYYAVGGSEEDLRRASTIMVSFHRKLFNGENIGLLTVIRSSDWPPEVEWKGKYQIRQPTIELDTCELLTAYQIALEEYKQYLTGIATASRVWP